MPYKLSSAIDEVIELYPKPAETYRGGGPRFAATLDTSDIPDGKWVYNSAWEYVGTRFPNRGDLAKVLELSEGPSAP